MARVAVGSVSLAVAEWPGPAKGPAVVCIHGLTANHTCWASVAANTWWPSASLTT